MVAARVLYQGLITFCHLMGVEGLDAVRVFIKVKVPMLQVFILTVDLNTLLLHEGSFGAFAIP